jgi:hypothetical protein
MTTLKLTPQAQSVTTYSRFVLNILVLPLLFIAGVQLLILSAQTETYFAWTFTAPISAAFLGAGYWAAMFHAWSGARAQDWAYVRTSMAASLTATSMLAITTYLHLEKFHLDAPLLITRFVTWVWIAVYVFVPLILAIAWIVQSRQPAAHARAETPLPGWMRIGFFILAAFALLCGLGLFFAPDRMSSVWPWTVPPLAARALASWLAAFGVACLSLLVENDIHHGAGTATSLCAFCILQLIVVLRYASAIDWGKPLAFGYILFLLFGLLITGANLLTDRRLARQGMSH